jgi:hypothetical protein
VKLCAALQSVIPTRNTYLSEQLPPKYSEKGPLHKPYCKKVYVLFNEEPASDIRLHQQKEGVTNTQLNMTTFSMERYISKNKNGAATPLPV